MGGFPPSGTLISTASPFVVPVVRASDTVFEIPLLHFVHCLHAQPIGEWQCVAAFCSFVSWRLSKCTPVGKCFTMLGRPDGTWCCGHRRYARRSGTTSRRGRRDADGP